MVGVGHLKIVKISFVSEQECSWDSVSQLDEIIGYSSIAIIIL